MTATPPTAEVAKIIADLRREIGPPTDRDRNWQPMVSAYEVRVLLDALATPPTADEATGPGWFWTRDEWAEWSNELAMLIPEDDFDRYSNSEGAQESCIAAVLRAYVEERTPPTASHETAFSCRSCDYTSDEYGDTHTHPTASHDETALTEDERALLHHALYGVHTDPMFPRVCAMVGDILAARAAAGAAAGAVSPVCEDGQHERCYGHDPAEPDSAIRCACTDSSHRADVGQAVGPTCTDPECPIYARHRAKHQTFPPHGPHDFRAALAADTTSPDGGA